jgi:hypothetical protein
MSWITGTGEDDRTIGGFGTELSLMLHSNLLGSDNEQFLPTIRMPQMFPGMMSVCF